jgi:hypothetical protein
MLEEQDAETMDILMGLNLCCCELIYLPDRVG